MHTMSIEDIAYEFTETRSCLIEMNADIKAGRWVYSDWNRAQLNAYLDKFLELRDLLGAAN